MAITKTQKIPRGFEVQQTKYLELFDGVRPSHGQRVAPYLPVIEEDRYHETFYTVEAGQFVAFDTTSFSGSTGLADQKKWLVIANGGESGGHTITYAADDIDLVPDIDGYESGTLAVVAAAGAGTKKVGANFPAGVAPMNYISGAYPLVHHNFEPQPFVPYLTWHVIEVPLIYDSGATIPSGSSQVSLTAGDLVKSSPLGWAVAFDGTISSSSDSLEQLCGRVQWVRTFAVRDSLDKVHTVPSFELPGTGTSGRQTHENQVLVGTSTKITRLARIKLLFL